MLIDRSLESDLFDYLAKRPLGEVYTLFVRLAQAQRAERAGNAPEAAIQATETAKED